MYYNYLLPQWHALLLIVKYLTHENCYLLLFVSRYGIVKFVMLTIKTK